MRQISTMITDINSIKQKVIKNQAQTREQFQRMNLRNTVHSIKIKSELERRRKLQ